MANDDKNVNQEDTDSQPAQPDQKDGKTINDPLTRSDVEAPRAEFEGRTPE